VEQLEVRDVPANVFALTGNNQLIAFDSASPGVLTRGPTPISGLLPGERILAIDIRPATGELYGLGSGNNLYRIDPVTGITVRGPSFVPPPKPGTGLLVSFNFFSFDFDPVQDRARIVAEGARGVFDIQGNPVPSFEFTQNFRVHPGTGQVTEDTALAYSDGTFADPNLVDVAHASGQVFGIDGNLRNLVKLGNAGLNPVVPPESGQLYTVGSLGFGDPINAGFDLGPGGVAHAASSVTFGGVTTSRFYEVNLQTGFASVVGGDGRIGNGSIPIIDIAVGSARRVSPPPAPAPAPVTGEVTAQVSMRRKRLRAVKRGNTVRFRVTITNTSNRALEQLHLVLDRLRRGVKVLRRAGMTANRKPYVAVGGDGTLTPGESVTVQLVFSGARAVTFKLRLWAGKPS
jgi:hypothetical protein